MSSIDPIGTAFLQAIDAKVFPGAVLLVRFKGQLAYQGAFGSVGSDPSDPTASLDTVYDLASLTKVLATTSAILLLVQQGHLQLEDRVATILPECQQGQVGDAQIHHLLSHSSGLPAWKSLTQIIGDRAQDTIDALSIEKRRQVFVQAIGQVALVARTGTRAEYSDLGFMLLGFVVERMTGLRLSEYCQQVFHRQGAAPLAFLPTSQRGGTYPAQWPPVAPTEFDEKRGRLLQGEVHDDNAYVLGGMGGHAGLFGSARAVLEVSGSWLNSYHGRDSLFSSDLTRKFVAQQHQVPGSSWALGWDTPSFPSSSGNFFSSESFGHLGFTGTSLWVDPVVELEVVLLSNRVYFSRENTNIRGFRREIHDIIWKEIVGEAA